MTVIRVDISKLKFLCRLGVVCRLSKASLQWCVRQAAASFARADG